MATWRDRQKCPVPRASESNNRRTEESKGTLSPVGNRASSVKVEGCLTASPIRRAGAKAGLSDPAVPDGRAVAQQIKGAPGITGLSPLSVHSGEEVWHLNTLGCCRSDSAPTNRLITVNPSVRVCTYVYSFTPGNTVGSLSSTQHYHSASEAVTC